MSLISTYSSATPCVLRNSATIPLVPLLTSNLLLGLVVPIPTFPFNAVVTIESFPSTTVFEPIPFASYPITI